MSNEIEKTRGGMRQAAEILKATLPDIANHASIVAKIQKAQFDAYVAEGFTVEQALYLTKLAGPGK